MSFSKKRIAILNKWFPFCGKCGICGHHDSRHRLWDAIIERIEIGETIEFVANDYDLPVEAILAVVEIRPYKRAKKKK